MKHLALISILGLSACAQSMGMTRVGDPAALADGSKLDYYAGYSCADPPYCWQQTQTTGVVQTRMTNGAPYSTMGDFKPVVTTVGGAWVTQNVAVPAGSALGGAILLGNHIQPSTTNVAPINNAGASAVATGGSAVATGGSASATSNSASSAAASARARSSARASAVQYQNQYQDQNQLQIQTQLPSPPRIIR